MVVRKVLIGTTVAGILVSSLLWGHMERMKKNEIKAEKGRIVAALEASESARLKESQNAKQVNRIAEEYQNELQAARNELDRLDRDDSVVVRVNADCTAVPENEPTTAVDNAGTARLGEKARQDYFDLRKAMKEERQKLIAVQAYARACYELTQSE